MQINKKLICIKNINKYKMSSVVEEFSLKEPHPSDTLLMSQESIVSEQHVENVHIFNDVDYTDYANDFLEDSHLYHDLISSYSTEDNVTLEIIANNISFGKVQFNKDSSVTSEQDETYESIIEWVKATSGDAYTPEYLFTNVFIGDDKTPLWKILEAAQLEEFVDIKPTKIIDTSEHNTMLFPYYFIAFIFSIYFGLCIGYIIKGSMT